MPYSNQQWGQKAPKNYAHNKIYDEVGNVFSYLLQVYAEVTKSIICVTRSIHLCGGRPLKIKL